MSGLYQPPTKRSEGNLPKVRILHSPPCGRSSTVERQIVALLTRVQLPPITPFYGPIAQFWDERLPFKPKSSSLVEVHQDADVAQRQEALVLGTS